MADGTLNHAFPVAIPAAISVLPTPVENAPSAPIGTCMRISTDDHIAGNSQAFFRQKCVLNSHLANIKIICDFMLTCKFAYAFAMLCGLDILVWNKMIHDKRDLILIKYIFIFKFVHLMNGYR